MRLLKGVSALVLTVSVGFIVATPAEAGAGRKHGHRRAIDAHPDHRVTVHVGFSPREKLIIKEYYAPRYRRLPPGLQKKYRRTGQLPPGWQKKLAPFPVVLERRLVVLPRGYHRGVFDGHAVLVDPRTQAIVDVATLF